MNRRYIRSFCERWLQCQITDSPLLITKHTGLDYGARLTAVISPRQKCHRIIIFTHSGAICSVIVYLCLWCVCKLASGNNSSLSLSLSLSLCLSLTHKHTRPLQICEPCSLPLFSPITEKTENGFGMKHKNRWRTDGASLFRCKILSLGLSASQCFSCSSIPPYSLSFLSTSLMSWLTSEG